MQRIDKIVAVSAGISRSDARRLILKGKVKINDKTVKDIAYKADPLSDIIKVSDNALEYKQYVYLIMNKPKGVVSASEDKKVQTVIDLVPEQLKKRPLFPVGRLDKNTTGLLLITDDGNFAHTLLSPKYKIPKRYLAKLDREVTDEVKSEFEKGLVLNDGTTLKPAKIRTTDDLFTAEITVVEGKYHQIKRMFGHFHIAVLELKRLYFAGINLPYDLSEGEVRELTENELDCIKNTKNSIKSINF